MNRQDKPALKHNFWRGEPLPEPVDCMEGCTICSTSHNHEFTIPSRYAFTHHSPSYDGNGTVTINPRYMVLVETMCACGARKEISHE